MPPTTRNQTAPRPTALFKACLAGNSSMVARLLEGPGADTLQRVGPGNITKLHAAVMGGAVAALPLLVAAGAELDAALELGSRYIWFASAKPARDFLESLGTRRFNWLCDGSTALALAVSIGDGACVQQLLELGASPDAGREDGTALKQLARYYPPNVVACNRLVGPFLERGLDVLSPLGQAGLLGLGSNSLLLSCTSEVASYLLTHLGQQRAAGQLDIGSKPRAVQLVMGAARHSHRPLLSHGIAALEQLLGVAAGEAAPPLEAADGRMLGSLLQLVVRRSNIACLELLLASQLPFDLSQGLVSLAAQGHPNTAAECVSLLHQAGAPITAQDLYRAVDELLSHAVLALLACGTPAVDTSQPSVMPGIGLQGYSCPIHRTLHVHGSRYTWREPQALQIVEALLAAGYQPCTWHNVEPPAFLQPLQRRVLPTLDPFDLYSIPCANALGLPAARCYRYGESAPSERLLFIARGGSWSPGEHHRWPDRFKAKFACALLLTASASAASRQAAGRRVTRASSRRHPHAAAAADSSLPCLGDLPAGVLLHILRLAAHPMSGWL